MGGCAVYCLDLLENPVFSECEFRSFSQGEHHMTRKWEKSVLLLVLKNELLFEEDGRAVSVRENGWYIQRGGLQQRGPEGSPAPEYFYVHFDGSFRDAASPGTGLLPIEGVFRRETVLPLIRELYDCRNGIETAGVYENTIFQYLLYELKKESGAQSSGLPFRIAEYISRNFDNPLSLRELALEFGYCEDYLGRVFKKQYQTSIHRYMTRLRLQKARQLLLYTERGIAQIAFEVGYSEASLFYKSFLKEEGVSPAQWREQKRHRDHTDFRGP